MSGAPLLLLMSGDPTPAFDLNFLGGMPAGLTYTNSSTERVYWDSTGTRRSAVANEPIFETLGGVAQGMRWEMEARTNLATNSEGEAATWTVANVTDAVTPISGFSQSLQFGDNSVTRWAYKTMALTAGVTYTVSAFIVMDDGNAPVVGTSTTTGDLAITSDGSLHLGTATIQRISGNIYRVSSAKAATVGGAARSCGVYKYATQSARTFRVIGIQIEAAASASSYIPTAGSAVIRQPDVLAATSISPWYRQDEGTVVFEGSLNELSDATARGWFCFHGGSDADRINGYATTTQNVFRVVTSTVQQALITQPVPTAGTRFKQAGAYKVNDFQSATNGTLGVADTGGTVPTITGLNFGLAGAAAGSSPFMGYARRFQYYNTRLPNTILQGLSRV